MVRALACWRNRPGKVAATWPPGFAFVLLTSRAHVLFSFLCYGATLFFIIHSMYFEWTLQGFNPGPGLTCSTHPNMASRIEAGIVLRGVEIPTGRRLKGIPLDWTAWQAWSWPHLAWKLETGAAGVHQQFYGTQVKVVKGNVKPFACCYNCNMVWIALNNLKIKQLKPEIVKLFDWFLKKQYL